jgi:hypothetical protein
MVRVAMKSSLMGFLRLVMPLGLRTRGRTSKKDRSWLEASLEAAPGGPSLAPGRRQGDRLAVGGCSALAVATLAVLVAKDPEQLAAPPAVGRSGDQTLDEGDGLAAASGADEELRLA